jgi:putative molybdopterin biosynthesis protein
METREQYYTLKEVRELLKISYITLYRWVQAGKIPAYKVGKQYRINKADYEEFIKSNKFKVKT